MSLVDQLLLPFSGNFRAVLILHVVRQFKRSLQSKEILAFPCYMLLLKTLWSFELGVLDHFGTRIETLHPAQKSLPTCHFLCLYLILTNVQWQTVACVHKESKIRAYCIRKYSHKINISSSFLFPPQSKREMRFNSLWWAASALILAPGSARQVKRVR